MGKSTPTHTNTWEPYVSECLRYELEPNNLFDMFAIKVCLDSNFVGQLPREISRPTKFEKKSRIGYFQNFRVDKFSRIDNFRKWGPIRENKSTRKLIHTKINPREN